MQPAEFRPAQNYDTNPYYDNAEWPGPGYVTIEPLSATENKTYTAEEGKAYSPVTVNVAPAIPTPKVTAQIIVSDPTAIERIEVDLIDDEFNVLEISDVKASNTVSGFCIPSISWDDFALAWWVEFLAYAKDESITDPYEFTYSNLVNCSYDSDVHSVLSTDPTQDVSFTATLTIE